MNSILFSGYRFFLPFKESRVVFVSVKDSLENHEKLIGRENIFLHDIDSWSEILSNYSKELNVQTGVQKQSDVLILSIKDSKLFIKANGAQLKRTFRAVIKDSRLTAFSNELNFVDLSGQFYALDSTQSEFQDFLNFNFQFNNDESCLPVNLPVTYKYCVFEITDFEKKRWVTNLP